MAVPTYSARGIVLRKTKLGECDLILTLLAEDGSIIRCVAKGARKPTSSFSSRLELFSEVELLCARGRSLDIVKEARLVAANDRIRSSVELATAAAPMAELLSKVAQEGLENAVLFQASRVALGVLNEAQLDHAPAICAAHLLKTLAYAGLRPSFDSCVGCGDAAGESGLFSFSEGGVICQACRTHCDCLAYPNEAIAWSRYLLSTRFADIAQLETPLDGAFAALRLSQGLIKAHVGANLKSLDFMFTCGLF